MRLRQKSKVEQDCTQEFEIIKSKLNKGLAKQKEKKKRELLMNRLNTFMFYVFLTLFIFLNLFPMLLLPFYLRESLTLDD